LVPSAPVSFKGPELYFFMIRFAGSVPVAFLWGVVPPLVAWAMWDNEVGWGFIENTHST
jgi:hypothetical protein